jgi:hypothetical protein
LSASASMLQNNNRTLKRGSINFQELFFIAQSHVFGDVSLDLVSDLLPNDQVGVSLEIVEQRSGSDQDDNKNDTKTGNVSFSADSAVIVPVNLIGQISVTDLWFVAENVADRTDDHFGLEVLFDEIVVDEHCGDEVDVGVLLIVNVRLQHAVGRVVRRVFVAEARFYAVKDFVMDVLWQVELFTDDVVAMLLAGNTRVHFATEAISVVENVAPPKFVVLSALHLGNVPNANLANAFHQNRLRFEVFVVSSTEAAVAVAVGFQKCLRHFVPEVFELVFRSKGHLVFEGVETGLEGRDEVVGLEEGWTHPVLNIRDSSFVLGLFNLPVPNRCLS